MHNAMLLNLFILFTRHIFWMLAKETKQNGTDPRTWKVESVNENHEVSCQVVKRDKIASD